MNASKSTTVVLLGVLWVAILSPGRPTRAAVAANGITPGQPRADATFEHIGVLWPVEGDDNLNSAMTLEFRRQGETAWQPGAPAMRAYPSLVVDGAPLDLNYWAASAMFLEQGQTYDLRLALSDPDGGGATLTITAATRLEPQAGTAGSLRYVIPGSGGGDGSVADPFRDSMHCY